MKQLEYPPQKQEKVKKSLHSLGKKESLRATFAYQMEIAGQQIAVVLAVKEEKACNLADNPFPSKALD